MGFYIGRKGISQHVREACAHFRVSFEIGRAGDGGQRYVINGHPYTPGEAANLLIVGGFDAVIGPGPVTFVESNPFSGQEG